jgi:hypothetical protein
MKSIVVGSDLACRHTVCAGKLAVICCVGLSSFVDNRALSSRAGSPFFRVYVGIIRSPALSALTSFL